jgi:hypothetical protein
MRDARHEPGARDRAAALAAELAALGVACAVEERAGLALLVPSGDATAPFEKPALRRAVAAAARRQGFTHVAIELAAG